MRAYVRVVLVALFAVAASSAQANPILLFNTGLTGEGSVDPNYQLISGPTCPLPPCAAFVTVDDAFPIGPRWMVNSATSKWIEPLSGTTDIHPAGTYIYRTTFDLTGLDPLTASISGGWAVDDGGPNILINNIPTGQINTTGFGAFTPFMITSGFLLGINTLDFVVTNAVQATFNPTGLRVEMTGTADPKAPTPVPGPATVTLVTAGLGALLAARRRRHAQRS